MAKKNYLSHSEQELWEYLKEKEIIDTELVKQIFPDFSANKINKILHSLFIKKYIQRARKDLYYNPKKLNSFHELALKYKNGYIGLSSALRLHNITEYEDFTIFVITKNYQKKVELAGTQYSIQYIPLKKYYKGFEKKEKLYTSTVEKTIFDCFLKHELIGLANITKAVYNADIDWKKLIEFYKEADNNSLFQRTGYVLDMMKGIKKIPLFVFGFLHSKVKSPIKLTSAKGKTVYNKKWMVQDNVGKKNMLSWWQ